MISDRSTESHGFTSLDKAGSIVKAGTTCLEKSEHRARATNWAPKSHHHASPRSIFPSCACNKVHRSEDHADPDKRLRPGKREIDRIIDGLARGCQF